MVAGSSTATSGASRAIGKVLDDIRVLRIGGGGPRTRPDAVLGDKAYGSGVNRRMLGARGITVVIPEKSDQIVSRKRKGSRGDRPPAFDTDAHDAHRVTHEGRVLDAAMVRP